MKKAGVVLEEKGRFFVQIGKQKQEIFPNQFGGTKNIRSLVGQKIDVVLTRPEIVALLPKKGIRRPQCFICYVPPPDMLWRIDELAQVGMLKSFVEKGILDQKIMEELTSKATTINV